RVSMGGGAVEVDPYLTSRTCSRCGWVDRDLRGAVFECEACGLRIDRQLNAAVNIYMRMEGVPRATRPPAYHPSGAARRSFHPPGDDVSRCAPAPRTFRANRFIRVSGNPH
ncbi:MAG: zinc ribbon domain-containing protein, partial [Conexivisphaera sp.]